MHRIAVLSAAHIHTQAYLQQLQLITEAELAGIWDDDVDRGSRYAEEFGTTFQPDLDLFLSDTSISGFLVLAESTRHFAILEKIIPLGKPIFCEKPIATSTQDAAKIKVLLDQYQTPFHTGYFLPFDGPHQAIPSLLEEKALGEVVLARFRNEHNAVYAGWFNHSNFKWFFDSELSGGGAFMDLGTHALHLLITLFGPVLRVRAEISNHSGIYSPIDDHGIAFLEFTSGLSGIAEASWISHGGPNGLEIQGTQAAYFNQALQTPGSEPTPIPPTFAQPTRLDRLIDILDGKVKNEALAVDLANSLHTVAVMEACYRSQESGAWEDVTPI